MIGQSWGCVVSDDNVDMAGVEVTSVDTDHETTWAEVGAECHIVSDHDHAVTDTDFTRSQSLILHQKYSTITQKYFSTLCNNSVYISANIKVDSM